ncbi:MAG: RnfABCDGE type electron transport complex subunit C, partial [Candidatus Omnitrophota bacterium]
MKLLTFRGGIHLGYHKDISIREPVRTGPLPDTVSIPLSQHIGKPAEPVVKKGDIVEEGQVIGKSASFVSSPVHSSIYGKVKDIAKVFHPALGPVLSVVIERDKDKEPRKYTLRDTGSFSPKDLVGIIRDAGIVGMGGAAFPTHVKLSVPEGKKIENLVINGAECEPFLTCDHTVMTRNTEEILKGIELLNRILTPKNIYLAIENNKKAAIFAFEKAIKKSTDSCISGIKLAAFKTKYPQGGEKQLIKALSGREV